MITQTEALVSIDVNSKRNKKGSYENMILHTNLEAAEIAAQQIFLRNLSGIIAIDFIDMNIKEHEKIVSNVFIKQFAQDKSKVQFEEMNKFSVLMMSRQRLYSSLQEVTHSHCQQCNYGRVKYREVMIYEIIADIILHLKVKSIMKIMIYCISNIAHELLNTKRYLLSSLEQKYNKIIEIQHADHYFIEGLSAKNTVVSLPKKSSVSIPRAIQSINTQNIQSDLNQKIEKSNVHLRNDQKMHNSKKEVEVYYEKLLQDTIPQYYYSSEDMLSTNYMCDGNWIKINWT